MWLVAETVDGNHLEYWRDGKCLYSFTADAELEILERIKEWLNIYKATPRNEGIT